MFFILVSKERGGFYLLFIFILFASCATIKTRSYDSTFIKKDSIHIVVKKDPATGGVDSIRYYESKVTVSHSPRFFRVNNVWYIIVSVLVAAAVLVRIK